MKGLSFLKINSKSDLDQLAIIKIIIMILLSIEINKIIILVLIISITMNKVFRMSI